MLTGKIIMPKSVKEKEAAKRKFRVYVPQEYKFPAGMDKFGNPYNKR